jgi:hypothetical protein
MQNVKWQNVSEADWDAIKPERKKQAASQWDEVIDALVDGNVVSIQIEDEKDVKGARIGIARRASSAHGVKLSFRYDVTNHRLVVRLREKAGTPVTTSGEKRGPGRPKKYA